MFSRTRKKRKKVNINKQIIPIYSKIFFKLYHHYNVMHEENKFS